MDFQTAVRTCLQNKYASFSGRAGRPEFWWFVLFGIIARIVAIILDRILFGGNSVHVDTATGSMSMSYNPGYIGLLVALALLVPSIAVGSRRMHDIGKSGWWQLIGIIPVIGWILVIYWFAQPSQGPNAYGTAPDAASSFA